MYIQSDNLSIPETALAIKRSVVKGEKADMYSTTTCSAPRPNPDQARSFSDIIRKLRQ